MAISIVEMKERLERLIGDDVKMISQGIYSNGHMVLRAISGDKMPLIYLTADDCRMEADEFEERILVPLAAKFKAEMEMDQS